MKCATKRSSVRRSATNASSASRARREIQCPGIWIDPKDNTLRCDSNYDVETEEGEDYDCKQNLWSGCYFLWPIAWIFFYLAIRRVNKLIEEGNKAEAKYVWIKRKWYWAVWKSTSAIRRTP